MDAAGSERAALFGISESGPMCLMFAATYPARTRALVLYDTFARMLRAPDYPIGLPGAALGTFLERIEETWGTGTISADDFAPSLAHDQRFRQSWARFERLAVSPAAAKALFRMLHETDARHTLSVIRVPTLVVHRDGDRVAHVEGGRYIAERIHGAKYVQLSGSDHFAWVGDTDAILDEVQEFLTGVRRGPEPDRALATVMFTDIVGATQRAVELGDRRWRDLLDSHNAVVREQLARFRGREIDTAGDGFLATFDGPARGIRCAVATTEGVRDLGLEIRAGLHTGEVEIADGNVRGIAVHIGSRVSGLAGPGEVLVSRTVADLVAGSGILLSARGEHELKGVPGRWLVYAVESV
jgi:class 3 adenylate cyclase